MSVLVLERIERNVIKWLRSVKKMGEERLVKKVYRPNAEGNRVRGRQHRRWRDELKELLIGRGLSERREYCCLAIESLGERWCIRSQ